MRLNQVTVPTTDLERGIQFYQGLGLQLIVRDDEAGYARFLCPDGDGQRRAPSWCISNATTSTSA